MSVMFQLNAMLLLQSVGIEDFMVVADCDFFAAKNPADIASSVAKAVYTVAEQ